jgi:hypothetical protein
MIDDVCKDERKLLEPGDSLRPKVEQHKHKWPDIVRALCAMPRTTG